MFEDLDLTYSQQNSSRSKPKPFNPFYTEALRLFFDNTPEHTLLRLQGFQNKNSIYSDKQSIYVQLWQRNKQLNLINTCTQVVAHFITR